MFDNCPHPVNDLYQRRCRRCGAYLKASECDHRRYAPWTDPQKVGEDKLWIYAERTRTCLQCGYVLTKRDRLPKNNELSRSHVYEVDPGLPR